MPDTKTEKQFKTKLALEWRIVILKRLDLESPFDNSEKEI